MPEFSRLSSGEEEATSLVACREEESNLSRAALEASQDDCMQDDQGKEAAESDGPVVPEFSRLSSAAPVFVPILSLDATLQSHGDLEAGEEAETSLVVFNEEDANESEAVEEVSWLDEVEMLSSGNVDEHDVYVRARCRELGRMILEEGKGVDDFEGSDGTLVAWGRIIFKTVQLAGHDFSRNQVLRRTCLMLTQEEVYLNRGNPPPSIEQHLLWICEQVNEALHRSIEQR